MTKQALVKLARVRLAINYVLRQRMTKQAFWPFSSKPKYNQPPSDILNAFQELANLNNKYLDEDPKMNRSEKDLYRLNINDIQDDGKNDLWRTLLQLRFSTDYDALEYEKAMRKDPAYKGIEQKLFELGKKYNVEPILPWEQ